MSTVIDRLVGAVNGYDLEGLVSCFAEDYVNETPVHPQRGFRGSDQVRTNWGADLRQRGRHASGSPTAGRKR